MPGARSRSEQTWSSVGNGILAVDLVDSKLVAKKQGLGYPGETSFDYKVSGKTAAIYRQVHQIWRHHSLYHVSRGRKPEV